MAKVAGKPGRYVRQVLSRKLTVLLLGVWIASMGLAVLIGVMLVHRTWPVAVGLLVFEGGLYIVLKRLIGKVEKELTSWKKGLDGELIVGHTLADDLPKNFCVIHDLSKQFGNLDHVVIGPTGVFAVETKNWRGTVTSDGKGELLQNGKPPGKPVVRNFTRSIMDIRNKLVALTQTDRFIHGVMVFPSAYVKAKWGTTGSVNCISMTSVPGYFLKAQDKKALSPQEVDALAKGFLALARMDDGFTD